MSYCLGITTTETKRPRTPAQIQRFRSKRNVEVLQNAPAEPAELRDFCAQFVRAGETQPPHRVGIDDQELRTTAETAVPFSADHQFHRLRD